MIDLTQRQWVVGARKLTDYRNKHTLMHFTDEKYNTYIIRAISNSPNNSLNSLFIIFFNFGKSVNSTLLQ